VVEELAFVVGEAFDTIDTGRNVEELRDAALLKGSDETLRRVLALVVGLNDGVIWLDISGEEGEEDLLIDTAFAEEARTGALVKIEGELEIQEVNVSVIQVVIRATECIFKLVLGGTDCWVGVTLDSKVNEIADAARTLVGFVECVLEPEFAESELNCRVLLVDGLFDVVVTIAAGVLELIGEKPER